MASTLFTKIINREIPARIVYETEAVLGFRDISPKAPTHILIIPKKEIPTLNDVDPADVALIGGLFLAAKEIAKQEGLTERGYRVVMNCGEDAGQTVPHIHVHLLGGRELQWPPG